MFLCFYVSMLIFRPIRLQHLLTSYWCLVCDIWSCQQKVVGKQSWNKVLAIHGNSLDPMGLLILGAVLLFQAKCVHHKSQQKNEWPARVKMYRGMFVWHASSPLPIQVLFVWVEGWHLLPCWYTFCLFGLRAGIGSWATCIGHYSRSEHCACSTCIDENSVGGSILLG